MRQRSLIVAGPILQVSSESLIVIPIPMPTSHKPTTMRVCFLLASEVSL